MVSKMRVINLIFLAEVITNHNSILLEENCLETLSGASLRILLSDKFPQMLASSHKSENTWEMTKGWYTFSIVYKLL